MGMGPGWASRDVIEGALRGIAGLVYIMYSPVRGFPVVTSYVAWRADQVLYGSYTLDRRYWYVQNRALGGEATCRAKEYGRPF